MQADLSLLERKNKSTGKGMIQQKTSLNILVCKGKKHNHHHHHHQIQLECKWMGFVQQYIKAT